MDRRIIVGRYKMHVSDTQNLSEHSPDWLGDIKNNVVVTVLLATYNGQIHIANQIRSILNQTFKNLKITILDDCSSDQTYNVLKTFAIEYDRITIMRNDKRLGAIKTFGKLVETVKTPFFCFSDQDDVWDTDKIDIELEYLISNDMMLVYSDLEVVDEHLTCISKSMWRYSKRKPISGSNFIPFILRNPASGCTILANSELIRIALPFPKELPIHDVWMVICATMIGKVGYIERQTLKYRQHSNNLAGTFEASLSGLRKRWKTKKGFKPYLAFRNNNRTIFLNIINNSFPNEIASKLFDHLTVKWPRKILHIPLFLLFLLKNAGQIGPRAILVELFYYLLYQPNCHKEISSKKNIFFS